MKVFILRWFLLEPYAKSFSCAYVKPALTGFFMLNLVPRPLFDEEIWVRDFVMLGLGFYRFNPVMSSLFSIDFSFMYHSSVQFSSYHSYSTLVVLHASVNSKPLM